jgi:hypothetical protein
MIILFVCGNYQDDGCEASVCVYVVDERPGVGVEVLIHRW